MKEMIWTTECARASRPRYNTAAIAVSVTKNATYRTLNIKLSRETIVKAAFSDTDAIDIGIDRTGFRLGIRSNEAGPCHLAGKALSGNRQLSLKVRPEWHLKPEVVLLNDVCALEIVKPGYVQARLPQSWSNAFV